MNHFTSLLIILLLSANAMLARDKKIIKDLDNDGRNDHIYLHYNKAKNIFNHIEINSSIHGTFHYSFDKGLEAISNTSDKLLYNSHWEIIRFDHFFILESEAGKNYLLFKQKSETNEPGRTLVIEIYNEAYSDIINEPIDIVRILPDNTSLNLFTKKHNPTVLGDTIIERRSYQILSYEPVLCYNIANTKTLDRDKTIAYNLRFGIGWAKSKIRRVIKDQKTGEEKFLFETYRAYPETSLRVLTERELSIYAEEELRLMRNELFADYGYIFNDSYLSWYFEQQHWYKPIGKEVSMHLSDIEKINIARIKQMEEKLSKPNTTSIN